MNVEKLIGWRKFTLAMCILVSVSILTGIDQVESAGYVTTVISLMGLYGLANVAAKRVSEETTNGHS